MENVVYEIVVGAIILGVVFGIVMLSRQSQSAIKEGVQQQSMIENVNFEETIGITGGIYSASKIKEAYRYSKISDITINVVVKKGAIETTMSNENDITKLVNEGGNYKLEIKYFSNSTETIRDDKNITSIGFYFTKQ